MEQIEKMLANRRHHLKMIDDANATLELEGNYSQYYQNQCLAVEIYLELALLCWRVRNSPEASLKSLISLTRKILPLASSHSLSAEMISGNGEVWSIARYAYFLLDQPVNPPSDLLSHVRETRSENDDVALDYIILDAIEGRDWRTGIAEPLERLASKKRQALAADTYRTYFALLDAGGNSDATDALVKDAEANYQRRGRDAFYGGGPTYMGGGPDNPYVVDFVLAAILKHIGWRGDSIHKWVW